MARRTLEQNDFPAALLEIPKLPETLYLEGMLPVEGVFLGVVGTRRHSSYGKEACEKIIGELADCLPGEIVIVSGLAVGIDAVAHRSALNHGLKTVAIPGSGLDPKVLHPPGNRALAEEIVARGGALLSEFPWEYPAGLHTFPQRNRIIAGLSRGVLVVEAPEKSGALITARFALEFNRDVFAVPGSIFAENARGTNALIREGAIPVSSGRDILEAWNIAPEAKIAEAIETDLSPAEKIVWEALREPLGRDELCRQVALPTQEAAAALTMLELKGLLRNVAGQFYRKE